MNKTFKTGFRLKNHLRRITAFALACVLMVGNTALALPNDGGDTGVEANFIGILPAIARNIEFREDRIVNPSDAGRGLQTIFSRPGHDINTGTHNHYVNARAGFALHSWTISYTHNNEDIPAASRRARPSGQNSHYSMQQRYNVTYFIHPGAESYEQNPVITANFVPLEISIAPAERTTYFGYTPNSMYRDFTLTNVRAEQHESFRTLAFEEVELSLTNTNFEFVMPNGTRRSTLTITSFINQNFFIEGSGTPSRTIRIAPRADLDVGAHTVGVNVNVTNRREAYAGSIPTFPTLAAYTFNVNSRPINTVTINNPEVEPDEGDLFDFARPSVNFERPDGLEETLDKITESTIVPHGDRRFVLTAPRGAHFHTGTTLTPNPPNGWLVLGDPIIGNPPNGQSTFTVTYARSRTVTFELNGGRVGTSTADVVRTGPHGRVIGETYFAPGEPTPTRANHRFDGWHEVTGIQRSNPALIEPGDVDGMQVTTDRTFRAVWAPQHTIIYRPGGGSWGSSTNDREYNEYYGENMPITQIPEREGYTFDRWRDQDGNYFTQEDLEDKPVEDDMTFTATWRPNTPDTILHPVTFVLAGGNVNGNTANITHNIENNTPIGVGRVPQPTRTGYTFVAWRELPATTNMTRQQVGSQTVTGPRTFTAHWQLEANNHPVTFVLNGGRVNNNTANITNTVTDGAQIGTGNVPQPTRTGYTFVAWRELPATTNMTRQQVGSQTVTGPRTFTAQWQVVSTGNNDHLVTFNLNGGQVGNSTANRTHTVGNNAQIGTGNVPQPTRNGYTFQGWRELPSTTNLSRTQVGSTVVTGPRTFTAQWQRNSTPPPSTSIHYVVFNLNGGHVNNGTANIAHSVEHNMQVGTGNVPQPTRAGHTFQGWRELPSTMNMSRTQVGSEVITTGPRTFTAQWQPLTPPGNDSSTSDRNTGGGGGGGGTPNIPPAWQPPPSAPSIPPPADNSGTLHHVQTPAQPEATPNPPNGAAPPNANANPQTGDTFSYSGIIIAILGILVSSIAISIIRINRNETSRGVRRPR